MGVFDINGKTIVLPDNITELRSHQPVAIAEAVRLFAERNVVFLDAPTGAGKTIIGEGVRQIMHTVDFGLLRAMYLCTTKSLQSQFLHDFAYAKLIKGRANYPTYDESDRFDVMGSRHLDAGMCTKKKFGSDAVPICDQCALSTPDLNMPVDGHEEADIGHCHFCHPWQYCPYYQAKWSALGAELAVANTSYFLTEANGPGEFGSNHTGKPKFGFFVIDEADTLESVLMSYVELALSRYAIRRLGLDLPRKKTKPESWLEWAELSFHKVAQLSKQAQQALNVYIEEPPPQDVRKDADSLERYVGQFARVVQALRVEPDNWVYDGYEEGGVKLKPITVTSHARSLLWRHGTKFLLMSATMVSPRQMASDLGLDEHEWGQVIVDSDFPVERRPVWVMSRANMTNKTKEEHWPKMVRGIEEVLDIHPGERVLIHTHSYPLTEYLNSALRGTNHGSRLLTYSEAKQRDSILESFKNTPNGVLLAPSLDRGIDLPDDLCRAIIIAKVPFPNLGDKQVKQRFYGTLTGKGWFLTETIRSLVQMTGRGMRHENDYCITYILDAQFASNIWKNPLARNRIPRWWTAALKWEPPRRL